MNINQLIERNKTVEEHRLKLIIERNHYKCLYENAISDSLFKSKLYSIVIIILSVVIFVLIGVALWAQSFNQLM